MSIAVAVEQTDSGRGTWQNYNGIVGVKAGFQCVEALGRIIIEGQSGRKLVWLSFWSNVRTILWSTYKLYDLHAI